MPSSPVSEVRRGRRRISPVVRCRFRADSSIVLADAAGASHVQKMEELVIFFEPQVILFVADCERAGRFYESFGFAETFRTPTDRPVKVELSLGGFNLGLALPEPAAVSHGLDPVTVGHRACITLWTDDVEGAYALALQNGARDNREPHPFLDGQLFVALVEDLDGHPIQFVQRVAAAQG